MDYYVTIPTLGDATDFGDLTEEYNGGGSASPTRGDGGGGVLPHNTDTIDYVQIMSTGNAVDFGDLTLVLVMGGCSNGHGGL